VRISRALLDAVVEHARREAPNECCGAIGVRGGAAAAVYPCRNEAASPLRFEMGIDLFYAMEAMEDGGQELGAIYHSHTRTDAFPSQTDVNWSGQYPGAEWLIVGLGAAEPQVRSFLIAGGRVTEVEVAVEG